jgi:hypothetical protein
MTEAQDPTRPVEVSSVPADLRSPSCDDVTVDAPPSAPEAAAFQRCRYPSSGAPKGR